MGTNVKILLDEKFHLAAKALIVGAQKEILISSFKFEHSNKIGGRRIADLFEHLCFMAKAGRTVKILVNKVAGQQKLILINKDAMRILTAAQCQARAISGNRVVHAKLLIVDGKDMIVGSHNWTARSLSSNFELSLLVWDPLAIAEARAIFFRLWDAGKTF